MRCHSWPKTEDLVLAKPGTLESFAAHRMTLPGTGGDCADERHEHEEGEVNIGEARVRLAERTFGGPFFAAAHTRKSTRIAPRTCLNNDTTHESRERLRMHDGFRVRAQKIGAQDGDVGKIARLEHAPQFS